MQFHTQASVCEDGGCAGECLVAWGSGDYPNADGKRGSQMEHRWDSADSQGHQEGGLRERQVSALHTAKAC